MLPGPVGPQHWFLGVGASSTQMLFPPSGTFQGWNCCPRCHSWQIGDRGTTNGMVHNCVGRKTMVGSGVRLDATHMGILSTRRPSWLPVVLIKDSRRSMNFARLNLPQAIAPDPSRQRYCHVKNYQKTLHLLYFMDKASVPGRMWNSIVHAIIISSSNMMCWQTLIP